jgi:L-lactate dehydrogenase complex protein LldE
MRVGLFIACFNDLLYPEVGTAVVRILRALGQDVRFPQAQTCCGQMHFNTGYRDECVPLARRFTDAFAGSDVVVTPSPSCAAMVRVHYPTVAAHALERGTDPGLASAVEDLSPRVYDLAEFLIDVLGITDLGARFPHRVAFHQTCHSTRLLGIGERPQRLLREVRDLELVDLAHPEACCGFGGTFAVKNADTSVAIGTDKVADVLATGAEVLTAADDSCLMHLAGLLSRQERPVRVMHYAEILATGVER